MTRRRQHSGLGDMVSTAAFLGMSLYLLLAGFEFKADGRLISAIGVWIACGLCFAGSIRYPIAKLYDRFERFRK